MNIAKLQGVWGRVAGGMALLMFDFCPIFRPTFPVSLSPSWRERKEKVSRRGPFESIIGNERINALGVEPSD